MIGYDGHVKRSWRVTLLLHDARADYIRWAFQSWVLHCTTLTSTNQLYIVPAVLRNNSSSSVGLQLGCRLTLFKSVRRKGQESRTRSHRGSCCVLVNGQRLTGRVAKPLKQWLKQRDPRILMSRKEDTPKIANRMWWEPCMKRTLVSMRPNTFTQLNAVEI